MLRLIAVVAIALLAAPAPALAHERTITVTGAGEASAAPDIADIRIGVETEADTADAAMAANADQASALIEAAKARGVAPADIQTSGLSVRPVYQDRRDGEDAPRIVAYAVSNIVSVRLRDLSEAGETLGGLIEAGANRLDGVAFGFADDAELLDQARRRAVADARETATLYAAAAGVALGPILTIDEAGGGAPRPQFRAMAEASFPLEAGTNSVTARVNIVWAIGEGE